MPLLTLFARKEPTIDPIDLAIGLSRKKDTVIYRDKECSQLVARWPWSYSNCPKKGQRAVTLNCWRWNLIWLD